MFFCLVKEISKKSGDYSVLSVTDLKLLALVHDLHVLHIGKKLLNYDVKNVIEIASDALEAKNEEAKVPYGFVAPAVSFSQGFVLGICFGKLFICYVIEKKD